MYVERHGELGSAHLAAEEEQARNAARPITGKLAKAWLGRLEPVPPTSGVVISTPRGADRRIRNAVAGAAPGTAIPVAWLQVARCWEALDALVERSVGAGLAEAMAKVVLPTARFSREQPPTPRLRGLYEAVLYGVRGGAGPCCCSISRSQVRGR